MKVVGACWEVGFFAAMNEWNKILNDVLIVASNRRNVICTASYRLLIKYTFSSIAALLS